MVDRPFIPRKGDPPGGRLEGWLRRGVQEGVLAALPPYSPPGGRWDYRPEQYARGLLARLRAAADDPAAIERVKDDGRAFRSWAEAVLLAVAG